MTVLTLLTVLTVAERQWGNDRVDGGSAVLGDDKVERAARQAQMEDVAE